VVSAGYRPTRIQKHLCVVAPTGIYWKPVWAVLAAAFELVLANAMHVKNVPGRKNDVNDAMWLADLLAHGLIRSSFVPPMAVQALRDLTRARKQLVREKVSHVHRNTQPSSPSLPPSSPPSAGCSDAASFMPTSAPITSIARNAPASPLVLPENSPNSASKSPLPTERWHS